jgi:predicted small lipoprotein YifL
MTSQSAAGFKAASGLAMLSRMQRRKSAAARSAATFAGLFFVALCLAGCGRKSGLDLPPSAAAAPVAAEHQEADAKTISPISKPAKPKPRVVPKRDLPIDILLN